MASAHHGLVDLVAATSAGRSNSRARQLHWIGAEIAAYLTLPPPSRGRAARWREVLSGPLTSDYLSQADAGMLRSRTSGGIPSPDSVRRVRRDCLRLLAAQAALPLPPLERLPLPQPLPQAPAGPARQAQQVLRDSASSRATPARQVRAAVVVALVRETGLRTGELTAIRVRDLDLDSHTLTYRPNPPASRSPAPARTIALSGPTITLLRTWLKVRAELTARVPRSQALLVSVAGNHDGYGTRRPVGLPLQPRGLTRAHTKQIATLNVQLAGSPGYGTLPRTLGSLRPRRDTL